MNSAVVFFAVVATSFACGSPCSGFFSEGCSGLGVGFVNSLPALSNGILESRLTEAAVIPSLVAPSTFGSPFIAPSAISAFGSSLVGPSVFSGCNTNGLVAASSVVSTLGTSFGSSLIAPATVSPYTFSGYNNGAFALPTFGNSLIAPSSLSSLVTPSVASDCSNNVVSSSIPAFGLSVFAPSTFASSEPSLSSSVASSSTSSSSNVATPSVVASYKPVYGSTSNVASVAKTPARSQRGFRPLVSSI